MWSSGHDTSTTFRNYSLFWVQYSLDLPVTCQRWGKAHRASAIPAELLAAHGFQGRGFFPDESTRFYFLVSYIVSQTALVKLNGSEIKTKRQKHGKRICRSWQGWQGVKRSWRETHIIFHSLKQMNTKFKQSLVYQWKGSRKLYLRQEVIEMSCHNSTNFIFHICQFYCVQIILQQD